MLWLEQFKAWLSASQEIAESVQPSAEVLSSQQAGPLRSELAAQAIPELHCHGIREKVEGAITQWLAEADAPNHLVILTNPIEPTEKYLPQALSDWQLPQALSPIWLAKEPLVASFERITRFIAQLQQLPNSQALQLCVIPNLATCFLRCIGGLDAIDTLRASVFADRKRFWLFGCPEWTWLYLDRTHHLKAEFEQVMHLPALGGSDLKTWLAPVREGLSIQRRDGYQDAETYFETLAALSLGLSRVAGRLWLRSLTYQCDAQQPEAIPKLIRQRPQLPEIPNLTMEERYFLYSLLLHQQLSLGDLATSLGIPEGFLLPQLQKLQHSGLVEQRAGLLSVSPAYYPRLHSDLKQNNFLVEAETPYSEV